MFEVLCDLQSTQCYLGIGIAVVVPTTNTCQISGNLDSLYRRLHYRLHSPHLLPLNYDIRKVSCDFSGCQRDDTMRILRDLLLFMSITASVSEETMVHACSSPLIIFGFEQTEMRRLMSSLEHGFENNRKVLGQLMKNMDITVSHMDAVDIQTAKLKGIHNAFRNQAMKIPLLWEKNEILLRYLVAPQKMLITYAISHNQVNDLQQTVCEDRDDSTDQPNKASNEGEHETLESARKEKDRKDNKVPPPSYENLEQILVHLCRDWSPQGELIRRRLYTEGIILKVLENIPAVNSIDSGSAARNNEEYCYTEDETPCDRHSRLSPTTVVSYADSIQNSTETAAEFKFANKSGQPTEFQRNGRTKFDSSCHHDNKNQNKNKDNKNQKNHDSNIKNINKNKYENQSKNQNQDNRVLRNSEGVRVLVPGAGLGRLASELSVLGYSVEANDCSGENQNSVCC
jgi:N2227-like protein